jgi:mannose-6-phosphate isomerase-like protein (cupin superfamily)
VYIFVQGSGIMIIDEDKFRINGRSIILVPDGAFHKVINDGDINLIFNCVFDGKRNH